MKSGNKGQMTVFMLLGLVGIAMVGLFIYIQNSIADGKIIQEDDAVKELTLESDQLFADFQQCVGQLAVEAITLVSNQGGYLDPECSLLYDECPNLAFVEEGGYRLPVLLDQNNGMMPPTREEVEERLCKFVFTEIHTCVSEPSSLQYPPFNFTLEGFQYSQLHAPYSSSPIACDAEIADNAVTISGSYPLLFSKKSIQRESDMFEAGIETELGIFMESIAPRIITASAAIFPYAYDLRIDCAFTQELVPDATIMPDAHMLTMSQGQGIYRFGLGTHTLTDSISPEVCP
ncbi:MAG: hypothetical protein ABIH34_03210 [Nanoarchaeota archaeon]